LRCALGVVRGTDLFAISFRKPIVYQQCGNADVVSYGDTVVQFEVWKDGLTREILNIKMSVV
jgi:hypothetical protein